MVVLRRIDCHDDDDDNDDDDDEGSFSRQGNGKVGSY